MAVVAIPLMIASAVVSAVGMIAQGQAAQAAAEAQAQQYRQQAEINRQQGDIAFKRQKQQGVLLGGEQKARMAAAGIDIDVGSPLELRGQTQAEYEWRAETDKWGYQTQAVQNENRASLAKFEGDQKMSSAIFGAVGGLLGTAGKAFSMGGGGGGGGMGGGSAPSWGGMSFGREVA